MVQFAFSHIRPQAQPGRGYRRRPGRAVLALLLGLMVPGALAAQTAVPGSQAEIALGFAPVVRQAAPAVVNIYASRILPGRASPFAEDPFFGDLFRGLGGAQPRVQNSLGSGVIMTPDGLVVSNYHVVGQADQIRVVLNDRREYAAEVVLGDEEADLAVLRLHGAENLPALSLRDSDAVAVGELVLAIGNPFGVGQTVSSGIVSGLARSAGSLGQGRGYFVQTDAAINPGNSGGALVDVNGQLVGINTAILSRGGGSNGIGFAIPADLVAQFLAQAQAGNSRFERPWAGVSGQAVDAGLAEALGMSLPEGMLVNDLHPASPFARDFRPGDVVLRVDGAPVNTPQEMIFRLAVAGIGRAVAVDRLRQGQVETLSVTLIAPPEQPARDPLTLQGGGPLDGLSAQNINPAVAEEMGLPADLLGVVITDPGPLVSRWGGLRPGDVITAINGQRIAATVDLRRAADSLPRGNDRWQIEILRDGRPMALRFRR